MNVNFSGYNENAITMFCDSTLNEGDAGIVVTVKEDATATKATSSDSIFGVLLAVRDGYCSVQTRGFAKVSTEGKIPCGLKTLAPNDQGGVEVNATGRQLYVIESDDNYAGIFL